MKSMIWNYASSHAAISFLLALASNLVRNLFHDPSALRLDRWQKALPPKDSLPGIFSLAS